MEDNADAFVGFDVAKLRNAVAVADGGRNGEIRYSGEFDADEASMRRVVKRLAEKHERIMFCYEAGPAGYGLCHLMGSMWTDYRSLRELPLARWLPRTWPIAVFTRRLCRIWWSASCPHKGRSLFSTKPRFQADIGTEDLVLAHDTAIGRITTAHTSRETLLPLSALSVIVDGMP